MRAMLLSASALALFAVASIAPSAEAGRFGPAGLGSNLHRRFVIKQAIKDDRAGRPVRRSAIVWKAGPSTSFYRPVKRWRRW